MSLLRTVGAVAAAAWLFAMPLAGQTVPTPAAGSPVPETTPLRFSLFDPSRFSMDHSYSVMFSSDGTNTSSQALYLNTMRYQLSAPLLLTMRWGMYHNPSLLFKRETENTAGAFVVPDFELQYRPSRNFRLTVRYSQLPAGIPADTGPFYHPLTD